MGEIMESLRRLQQIELRMGSLRRREADKQRKVDVIQNSLNKLDQQIKDKQDEARRLQMQVDELSLDAASKEQTVAKHKEALGKARSNKEYAAILTAMNTEKADTSKLETRALEVMESVQEAKKAVEGLQVDRAKMVERLATAAKDLAEIKAELKPQWDEANASRTECVARLNPQTLTLFSRIAERWEGEALAAIERVHPKREEYACSGCNMKVTLDVYNALHSRDEVLTCKVCGRILCAPQLA